MGAAASDYMSKLMRKRRAGRKPGESPTSARRLAARLRAAKALDMRIAGSRYSEIAIALGYKDARFAWDAVNDLLRNTIQEPANELRRLEAQRIDDLFKVAYALAVSLLKDVKVDPLLALKAVDRCVDLMQRRARLLGLDAPMIFDWRREAKEKGLPAAEQFEQMVGDFYEQLRTAEK